MGIERRIGQTKLLASAAFVRSRTPQRLSWSPLLLSLFAGLALLCVSAANAQLAVPSLTARVTDQTGTLTAPERASLESRLEQLERESGAQAALLIVPTTSPEAVEQYSIRVAEAWKLGRKAEDDGVLILVAQAERTVRIEVGHGLEGALSDVVSKRIIEEHILPRFREGDFAGGLRAGIERIAAVVKGEGLPPPPARASGEHLNSDLLFNILLGSVVAGSVLRNVVGKLSGAVGGALICLVLGSIFLTFLVSLLLSVLVFCLLAASSGGRYRGGGYGGGGFSTGGGFGGGGGGFSGGGGSFGGGGASGRW